jgi:hypothetical protein
VGTDRAFWLDAALAISIASVVLADALLASARTGGLAPLDYVLLLGGTLVLLARRRAPRTVLLVTVIGMVGYSVRAAPDAIVAVPVCTPSTPLPASATACSRSRWRPRSHPGWC